VNSSEVIRLGELRGLHNPEKYAGGGGRFEKNKKCSRGRGKKERETSQLRKSSFIWGDLGRNPLAGVVTKGWRIAPDEKEDGQVCQTPGARERGETAGAEN